MKIKVIMFISGAFVLMMTAQSCKKILELRNEKKVSAMGNTHSHNMGRNCMDCHKKGGKGEGWFNVAGTVYDSLLVSTYPNATVRLYTGPNGTGALKYTIQVDGNGNFYTTNTIDFGSGLYPSVEGKLTTYYMPMAITSGQCNSCHGSSAAKIGVK